MEKIIVISWILVKLALIFGIIFLAYQGIQGWGWLVFLFVIGGSLENNNKTGGNNNA